MKTPRIYIAFVTVLMSSASPAHSQSIGSARPPVYRDSILTKDVRPAGFRTTTDIVSKVRMEPLVIRKGIDTYRMEVTVDPSVRGLQIRTAGRLLRNGVAPEWLRFYDDGTNGDVIVGDKIFTLDKLSIPASLSEDTLPCFSKKLGFESAMVEYTNGDSLPLSMILYPTITVIDPARVPFVSVQDRAPDIRASSYCLNFVASNDPSSTDLQVLANRYYSSGGQEKDFLLFEFPFYSWGVSGTYGRVSNDAQGFGLTTYSHSSMYGSAGALKGILTTQSMSIDPGLLNHEVLHHWAVCFDASLNLGGEHWGAIERPSTGFGNFWGAYKKISTISPGNYRGYLSDPNAPYSDFELYLMGLASPAEVKFPIRVVVDPVSGSYGTDPVTHEDYVNLAGSNIRDVSLQDIVAAAGARNPSVSTSQKQFSMALVVVYDRKLTDVEFAYFDYIMRQYEQPIPSFETSFAHATGGRASMTTRLSTAFQLPAAVTLMTPVDEAVIGLSDTTKFSWYVGSPFISTYWLEYATNAFFTSGKVIDSTITDNKYRLPSLRNGSTRYWRVRARNIWGLGPYSEVRKFTVSLTGVEEKNEVPARFALEQNYPNPFNPVTTIHYTVGGTRNLGLGTRKTMIVVYDLLGRQVTTLVNEEQAPGSYQVRFDGSGLASGIYVYRLTAGSFVQSRKMLLLK